MKKTLLAAAILVFAGSAVAGPHFVSADASVGSAGALTVSFDETGLGNGNVNYTLTGQGAAVYACFNHGGKNPAATNKVGPSALDPTSATFRAKNGRVQGSLTSQPPDPGTFTCPSGQDTVLACVKYTNVVLTDTTNGVTASQELVSGQEQITGSFERTFRSVQACSSL
jgi:hypothetical protein